MTTTISDLLEAIHDQLEGETVDVGDAAAALVQVERVVNLLVHDGLDPKPRGERETVAVPFANRCGSVGRMWESEAGRTAGLVGIVGDIAGKLRDELTRSDRWAIVVQLEAVGRRCAAVVEGSGPYEHVPQLKLLRQAAKELRRTALSRPVDPARCRGLRRPVPGAVVIPRSPAESVYEAVAVMIDEINRRPREPLSVRQMVGICRAADAVELGVRESLGSAVGSRSVDWRLAAERLAAFEDGVLPSGRNALLEAADLASRSITSVRAVGAQTLCMEDREALRRSAELLPAIAAALEIDLQLRTRGLIVPVGKSPIREARVGEWLTRKAFMATRDDLKDVVGLFAPAPQHRVLPAAVEGRSAGLHT